MTTHYDHDYPNDHEHEYSTVIDGAEIRVSKVGGGTIGHNYPGYWHYCVVQGGAVSDRGSDLHTPVAHTHAEAAETVADFLLGDIW